MSSSLQNQSNNSQQQHKTSQEIGHEAFSNINQALKNFGQQVLDAGKAVWDCLHNRAAMIVGFAIGQVTGTEAQRQTRRQDAAAGLKQNLDDVNKALDEFATKVKEDWAAQHSKNRVEMVTNAIARSFEPITELIEQVQDTESKDGLNDKLSSTKTSLERALSEEIEGGKLITKEERLNLEKRIKNAATDLKKEIETTIDREILANKLQKFKDDFTNLAATFPGLDDASRALLNGQLPALTGEHGAFSLKTLANDAQERGVDVVLRQFDKALDGLDQAATRLLEAQNQYAGLSERIEKRLGREPSLSDEFRDNIRREREDLDLKYRTQMLLKGDPLASSLREFERGVNREIDREIATTKRNARAVQFISDTESLLAGSDLGTFKTSIETAFNTALEELKKLPGGPTASELKEFQRDFERRIKLATLANQKTANVIETLDSLEIQGTLRGEVLSQLRANVSDILGTTQAHMDEVVKDGSFSRTDFGLCQDILKNQLDIVQRLIKSQIHSQQLIDQGTRS